MDARTIIAKARLGKDITTGEARWFGHALHGGAISDAQAGAFAMAVCLKGLSTEARVALTMGMRDSGDVLDWELDGPVLDKHSTGGVGDAVSLLLAPALAECGAFVPMISGHGLGHTGGTLDKLEAIPGYVSAIGPARLTHVLKEAGCAIVGATGRVAPSDKRLYAIRDVTDTVASVDLITASILSKKLAAGLDGLVLDVKTGSGAFMEKYEDAEALATSLVDVANGAGCKAAALITDMSQPLVPAAGNAVEIRAVMEVLTGTKEHQRFTDVAVALGAVLLERAGLSKSGKAAKKKLREIITSGAAAERFGKMVGAMGGPLDFTQSWRNCLPEATVLQEVLPAKSGYVSAINTRALGEAVVALGGGRLHERDRIDPAVGLAGLASIGSKLDRKTPLCMIHASDPDRAARAAEAVRKAYKIGSSKPEAPELIHREIAP